MPNPNMFDVANAIDPQGQVAAVVEILNQTNEMIPDMTYMEGNLTTGNRSVIRTGLPSATWRKYYGGVQPDKSTRAQVTDSCGMLEAYAEIDVDLAKLSNNVDEFRMQESTAFLESMTQDLQETLIYGNTEITPERTLGIMPRYNDSTANNSDSIIKAGGAGADNRSILLVVWSPSTVFGMYPKGSQAGIQVTDKGQVTIENADGSNGRMEAYRTHFQLKAGLCVRDWRYIIRICNIDYSLLSADASTGANLPNLMFQALERVPNLGVGNPVFYMSRDVRTTLRQQLAHRVKDSTLEYKDVGGHRAFMFQEVPVRRVDRMGVDEALVS